jgi:hypothetical protein
MAKPQQKPSLQGAFDDDTHLQPVTTATQKAGNGKRLITEGNSLVAANLPVGYGRALAVLAAEEGVTKKDLMQEAFDLLFKARGRAPL